MGEAAKFGLAGLLGILIGVGAVFAILSVREEDRAVVQDFGTMEDPETTPAGKETGTGNLGAEAEPNRPGSEGTVREENPGPSGESPAPCKVAALEKENRVLKMKMDALLESLEKEPPPPPKRAGVFRFGLGEKTPIFDQADWKDLSGHMLALGKAIPKLAEEVAKGNRPSDATMRAIQKHNAPLAVFAVQASEELEGTGPNGSYTHPAVIANMIRSALVGAGDPLTPEQEIAIRALGNALAVEPVAPRSLDLMFPHVERVQEAARAQVAAIERIVGMGQLNAEQVEILRAVTTVICPQVVQASQDSGIGEGD
ncbi:MAG: hypothetical protein ACYTHM_03015 [Planctomycetota bacterium]|jgi:hypothetical protein